MDKCVVCGNMIIGSGIREGDLLFCGEACRQKGGPTARASAALTPEEIGDFVNRALLGPCPRCGGPGPVDVHTSYTVWSILVFSSFGSKRHLVCKPCGFKAQSKALLFTLVFGWWGFPFGVFGTPVQIVRNLSGMFRRSETPSKALEDMIRLDLAARKAGREGQGGK